MAEEHHFIARTTAGRAALVVCDEQPRDVAADMLRGFVAGFVLAAAEVNGWDDTFRFINEISRSSTEGNRGPRLVYVNPNPVTTEGSAA